MDGRPMDSAGASFHPTMPLRVFYFFPVPAIPNTQSFEQKRKKLVRFYTLAMFKGREVEGPVRC